MCRQVQPPPTDAAVHKWEHARGGLAGTCAGMRFFWRVLLRPVQIVRNFEFTHRLSHPVRVKIVDVVDQRFDEELRGGPHGVGQAESPEFVAGLI